MAAARVVAVLVVVAAAAASVGVRPAEAAAHKVGDAVGWTILGSPNYTAWAVSKSFKLGDTVAFVYNRNFHNVLEVSKADYKACSTASPVATYTSGNDSIPLRRRGHHFFICGVPGHCSAGQKVDIRIAKLPTAAAATTAPSPDSDSDSASSPAAASSIGGGVPAATPAASPRTSSGATPAKAPRGVAGFVACFAVLCLGRLMLLQ